MTTPTTPNTIQTNTNSPIKKTPLPTVSPRSSSNDSQKYFKFSTFRKRSIFLCILIPLWLVYAIKQYHLNNNNEAIASVNRYIRGKALLLEQEHLKQQEQQLLIQQQQQQGPHMIIMITKQISTTTTISSRFLRKSDMIYD
jgi:inorganic pyrophosphatase/exopolyphosphatase